jgi:DNA polymerase-3 subunit gamma/tau
VSYTVFARKYRPQTFDEVVGQDHIVRTLKNAIEQNRLAQAYLFVGPRGTGKTSTARIFAKALNCINAPTTNPCGVCDMCKEIAAGNSLNVLEFDAASNTQVDKIRELIIDNVKYAPTRGNYKLYIVDEVHMLSNSSFNALLKTLEEPPAHVKFVFATTDVQKVPTTIISRCQRFDLRRIPTPEIARHLLLIAGKEGIALEPAASETIARGAEGGLRDAESMLDQLVAFCGNAITEQDVLDVFGFTAQQTVADLCEHLLTGQTSKALALLHTQSESGRDLSRLLSDLIAHFRNLLVIQHDPQGVQDELTPEAISALAEQSSRISTGRLLNLIEQFAAAENRMKWAANKKMHFEIAAIRAIQTLGQATLTEVLDTLTAIRGGAPLPERPAGTPPSSSAPVSRAVPAPVSAPVQTPTEPPPKPAAAKPRMSLSATVAASLGEKEKKAPTPAPAAPPPVQETSAAPTPPAPSPEAPERAAAAALTQEPTAKPAQSETAIDPAALWSELNDRVRTGRPLIRGLVESGALLEIADNKAVVGFPPEQWIAMETCDKPNHRKFLEQQLTELAGRPITIQFVKREGLVVEPSRASLEKAAAEADPMQAFKDDPLIKKALEAFRAEIVES